MTSNGENKSGRGGTLSFRATKTTGFAATRLLDIPRFLDAYYQSLGLSNGFRRFLNAPKMSQEIF